MARWEGTPPPAAAVRGGGTDPALTVRAATPDDADAVATILAQAFPGLYRSTFGRMGGEEIAWLLAELYRGGVLSLATTRVGTLGGRVVGVAVLHLGESIGRGSMAGYWRLLRQQLGIWRAPRAFFGGISTNIFLSRRIPHAGDLVYIEALAVAETERGRGVGSRLLADSEEWTCRQGRTRQALHVLYTNHGARRLYARLGFRPWHPTNEEPKHVSPWAALLLVRSLPASQASS